MARELVLAPLGGEDQDRHVERRHTGGTLEPGEGRLIPSPVAERRQGKVDRHPADHQAGQHDQRPRPSCTCGEALDEPL